MFDLFRNAKETFSNTSNNIQSLGKSSTIGVQPMQAHQWRVELPLLDGSHTSSNNINHRDLAAAQNKGTKAGNISDRVASVTTPFPAITTERASDGNSHWIFAKHNELGNLVLEMYEYNDGRTMLYFQSWFDHIMTSGGTYFPPVVWKRDVVVYRTSNIDNAVIKHTYKGVFPQNIADMASNYETSDFTKISVQLACDAVETKVIELEQGSADNLEAIKADGYIPSIPSIFGS